MASPEPPIGQESKKNADSKAKNAYSVENKIILQKSARKTGKEWKKKE